ncbi:MAG: 2OG-Fe(II) oxygenase [Rhodospirillaceae bacterium]|nr:2OG-Fe(II) oxygenase [Rhodospirillaceae bacterium]
MPVPSSSTLLLRGGHRWDCAAADAQAVLAYLANPHPDQHKIFSLRGADGQTLTVPAREIVGVLDGGQVVAEAPIPPVAAMCKKAELPGSPYLLVDEFLSASESAWVLAYALSQEPSFIDAKVTDSANDYRKAKVLYDLKPIVDLFLPRVRAMAPEALRTLDLQPVNIKTIECQLTAHGEGDYFKRHNDNGSKDTAQRYLSYVYYFNRAPAGFSGGMLRMYETVVENGFYTMGKTFQDIKPRNNCLVMFPSHCPHEVTPVSCPSGQFADWRFTVNGWVVREA